MERLTTELTELIEGDEGKVRPFYKFTSHENIWYIMGIEMREASIFAVVSRSK